MSMIIPHFSPQAYNMECTTLLNARKPISTPHNELGTTATLNDVSPSAGSSSFAVNAANRPVD